MKKLLIISGAIILLILIYTQVILSIYVHLQAKSICTWINKDEGPKPAVGPQAYEHLKWIKAENAGDCQCEVVEPNRDFFEDDDITILITKNSVEKIRLNYTFSSGVKNFMKPHYFHHQTNFEHEHSQYRFNRFESQNCLFTLY